MFPEIQKQSLGKKFMNKNHVFADLLVFALPEAIIYYFITKTPLSRNAGIPVVLLLLLLLLLL